MKKEIRIIVTAPADCTDEQFEEWIKFNLYYIGGISVTNPLCDFELEIKSMDITNIN